MAGQAPAAGSLQFTISGKQIRDFKIALQALGKIGGHHAWPQPGRSEPRAKLRLPLHVLRVCRCRCAAAPLLLSVHRR